MLTWSLPWLFLLLILSFSFPTFAYTILHFSDMHFDPEYNIDGDRNRMCHLNDNMTSLLEAATNPRLGPYGDYKCDSPAALIAFAVREARRLVPAPDLVVWTGDNIPHEVDFKQPDPTRDMEYVHRVLAYTTSQVYGVFNSTSTILPVFGNHDYAPPDQFEPNSTLYDYALQLWQFPIRTHLDNEATFRRGGFYKYLLSSGTVLVLNTNLYYQYNFAVDNFTEKADPAGQFAFIERELRAAAACQPGQGCRQLVHIVAHIAPGAFERSPNITWLRPEYNKRLVGLIAEYADNIGWLLFGHHHTDTFHIVRDPDGEPVQLLLMAPAVTPWKMGLEGGGSNNPAFRVYDVDERTGAYRKISYMKFAFLYMTYYADVTLLNSGVPGVGFRLEYEMKDAYSLAEGITARTMDQLIDRMRDSDSVFMQYYGYNSVGFNVTRPDPHFRAAHLCALSHADLDDYFVCLEDAPPRERTASLAEQRTRALLTVAAFVFSLLLL